MRIIQRRAHTCRHVPCGSRPAVLIDLLPGITVAARLVDGRPRVRIHNIGGRQGHISIRAGIGYRHERMIQQLVRQVIRNLPGGVRYDDLARRHAGGVTIDHGLACVQCAMRQHISR